MTDPSRALRQYVDNVMAISADSYKQEPDFVAALLGRLEGTAWESDDGSASIKFLPAVVSSRGANSAEKRFGADFALTMIRTHDTNSVRKAVLGQAKRGDSSRLGSTVQHRNLQDQCNKMASHTEHFLLMETPNGSPLKIRKGRIEKRSIAFGQPMNLSEYLINELVACHHGDKRGPFIRAVQSSDLPGLNVQIQGLNRELRFDPEPPRPSAPRTRRPQR